MKAEYYAVIVVSCVSLIVDILDLHPQFDTKKLILMTQVPDYDLVLKELNRLFQIIFLVMVFGCIIISDCGRMMIWKVQMAVEGSEWWKQFLIYWKKFKRKCDTGCGLCPDLEIEGWETNSY